MCKPIDRRVRVSCCTSLTLGLRPTAASRQQPPFNIQNLNQERWRCKSKRPLKKVTLAVNGWNTPGSLGAYAMPSPFAPARRSRPP